jgi:hypothetical protein
VLLVQIEAHRVFFAGCADYLVFLVTALGKPFSPAGFGNWFREICDAVGLPKRFTSHGLRKVVAKRLAERGATTTGIWNDC